MADTGLTGRKIIVDTYGGSAKHGGGAFSGKDATKVDRSGAYMARYVAKNLVAAGVADRLEIQLGYAIGVSEPLSINLATFHTAKYHDDFILKIIRQIFDFRPGAIIQKFSLNKPEFKYQKLSAYGHFGRDYYKREVEFIVNGNGNGAKTEKRMVEFFTWEKLDYVDTLKKEFGL